MQISLSLGKARVMDQAVMQDLLTTVHLLTLELKDQKAKKKRSNSLSIHSVILDLGTLLQAEALCNIKMLKRTPKAKGTTCHICDSIHHEEV